MQVNLETYEHIMLVEDMCTLGDASVYFVAK